MHNYSGHGRVFRLFATLDMTVGEMHPPCDRRKQRRCGRVEPISPFLLPFVTANTDHIPCPQPCRALPCAVQCCSGTRRIGAGNFNDSTRVWLLFDKPADGTRYVGDCRTLFEQCTWIISEWIAFCAVPRACVAGGNAAYSENGEGPMRHSDM